MIDAAVVCYTLRVGLRPLRQHLSRPLLLWWRLRAVVAVVCLCCRREYNRRVREVVEQSWIEQDT